MVKRFAKICGCNQLSKDDIMLCIETANVQNNRTTLAVGEQSSMGMTVIVTPMVE